MARFLVILRSGSKFEVEEPDSDCVLATLHKRGYRVGETKSIVPLDENGIPITLVNPEPIKPTAPESINETSPASTLVKCPICGARMVIRKDLTTRQPYWGCKGFPWCRGRTECSDLE